MPQVPNFIGVSYAPKRGMSLEKSWARSFYLPECDAIGQADQRVVSIMSETGMLGYSQQQALPSVIRLRVLLECVAFKSVGSVTS